MSKTIYEATLSEALPDSISGDVSAQAVCAGIDPQIRAMCAQIDVPAWMSRVQTMSSDELDHVAYTFGSHVWMKDWSLEQKRAYIVEVVANKKIIGTPAAIIDVFTQLGYTVRYEDCMSHESMEPGTFLVSLVNEPVPLDDQWQMRWIVDNVKPASRTWRWDNRIEARHTARAVAAFTGCMWQRHEAVLTEEVVEEFGEVIKGYFTTAGEAGTTNTEISSVGVLVYDASGNPLVWEDDWNYTAQNKAVGIGTINPSVLGDGPSGIVYTSSASPDVGEQVEIYTTYANSHDSKVVFLFRAKESFYMVYAAAAYKAMQYASKLEPGASCSLYPYGGTTRLSFSRLASLKLVEVFDISGNRQGVDGLSIEQDSSGYAMLVNNRSTQVDPQRLIFTNSGGE